MDKYRHTGKVFLVGLDWGRRHSHGSSNLEHGDMPCRMWRIWEYLGIMNLGGCFWADTLHSLIDQKFDSLLSGPSLVGRVTGLANLSGTRKYPRVLKLVLVHDTIMTRDSTRPICRDQSDLFFLL